MMQPQCVPAGFHLQERHDHLTGKSIVTIRHSSGLTVKYLPFPGFARKFAALTVPFGSIHTQFLRDGEPVGVPAGTAHFLEHCVFSQDASGGLSGRLSELGASANAYTTYDHTLYYFSTVNHFQAAFDTWLDSVFQPQIDDTRIASERPIILAELDQYRDDPDARCTQLLLENLYSSHPVRHDIGGTTQSVSAIRTADLLNAWQSFYRPDRLTLTIAGEIMVQPLLERLAQKLAGFRAPARQSTIRPVFPQEPLLPDIKIHKEQMDLAVPLFMVGIKDPVNTAEEPANGMARAIRQRSARLVLNTLLSSVSPLFDTLYREGLINDSFGYHYADDFSFSLLLCGGESDNPDQAAIRLQEGLMQACRTGLDPALFSAQKRAAAGDMVRSLDSVDQGGLIQARCNLLGLDLFDYPGIYDKIDPEQAIRLMHCLSDPTNYATAIIEPRR
jgi:predicted Zn-dependent peptidase